MVPPPEILKEKILEVKEVIPEVKEKTPETVENRPSLETEPIREEKLLDKLITLFRRILFSFFTPVILIKKELPRAKKILWYIIRPIRAVPRRICQKINPVRGPSVVVLAQIKHPRTTKPGGQNENQNLHWIASSPHFLFWRSQNFRLWPSAV